MNTIKPANIVSQIQATCTELVSLRSKLQELTQRYEANGGQSFLHPYFVDENENLRQDLNVSEDQIVTAMNDIITVRNTLDSFIDTFIVAE